MNRKQSSALMQRACRTIPGGVNSPVRAFKGVGGDPVFFDHADALTVRCRRQSLHRLHRLLGTDGTWPQPRTHYRRGPATSR